MCNNLDTRVLSNRTKPRDKFDKDLISFITKILRKGENVVLGIDMNEDARSGKLAQQLSSMGLRDLILSTCVSSSPPSTFNRNNSRIPADTIGVVG